MHSRYGSVHIFTAFMIAFTILFVTGCATTHKSSTARKVVPAVKSADGSPIAYGVQGKGDITIVFVHGWACNHLFWEPQIAHFSKTHKVVWLDLAGHGYSGSKRRDYTMRAFGEDVAAVARKVAGDNIILVGHSMGGPVSIEAADLLGERVLGIVGVDIFFTGLGLPDSEQGISELMKPFEDDFLATSEKFARSMFNPQADPRLVESIAGIMSGADKKMAISALRETLQWLNRNTSSLPTPSVPGKHLAKLRNINGTRAATSADGKTATHKNVITIPDVNHFVAQVKPDAFNRALEKIISEYRSF
uniref:Pimeloyl-ACP methyl ester carboxylesterase n=1 Tax=Candidatus Kentrum sp. SD TaxID=2126332 RepID=A0A450YWL2_9GAMM|nr:MAG: Pimeloyl-ACP methyl ester carboxylesterase [Candidatus Kentron sp. SD]VFK45922.1 MAG: Pimeloyl-ACP methyl ester carboxylesterase [Candidatus Kentron sp. SD]VFK79854.1 MAG: Pimeloyl-ACP methyl ester carboxylesterase [Candidatus Kentron sp. SD]